LSATHGDKRPEEGAGFDNNLLTFHEKVDNIYDEQEELRNKHLEYLKQAA